MGSNKKANSVAFNNVKTRTEKDVLSQRGEKVKLGNLEVEVKPLPWDDANALEDKILEVLGQFDELQTIDTTEKGAGQKVVGLIKKMLRDDLLAIVCTAVPELDEQKIKESGATKAEVINLAVEAIAVNYGYVKNFVALASGVLK